ncbi:MAG: VWA domain-containing protein [Victivallaceae bacterium]|nr:VWA domain-containing protein [Victivallaceae bacterium]
MSIMFPAAFLVLLPLAALFMWRRHHLLRLDLPRAAVYLLLAAALAGIVTEMPRPGGVVMVVADRSRSMPPDAGRRETECAKKVMAAMPVGAQTGVIGFGGAATVEKLPEAPGFEGLSAYVDDIDSSDLAGAVELALQYIPADRPGRILIVSDGRWTRRDPAPVFARAAARNVAVDYRLLERRPFGDLAITGIDAPAKAAPGEFYTISVGIVSPDARKAICRIRKNGGEWKELPVELQAGENTVFWRDGGSAPGVIDYRFEIKGTSDVADEVPENNTGRVLVEISGRKPLLLLSSSPSGNLARLLKANGFDVAAHPPSSARLRPESLAGCSGVILENVPVDELGVGGMELLRDMVRTGAVGVMVTGGRQSFAVGGYFHSPLDGILPVSMEQRKEVRKSSLAIAVALDRSGSMGMTVEGGTKMDMADQATVEVLSELMPSDEFAAIAVDSSPHVVIPLTRVSELGGAANEILRIESEGGGIFCYTALVAAIDELKTSNAGTRHVLLFADAADAEEPDQYQKLLGLATSSGITVSVVGLGNAGDRDAEFLKDIAARGGGECFFCDRASDLPRIFVQDLFQVARNSFVESAVAGHYTGAARLVGGAALTGTVNLGGYNLCYPAPNSQVLLVSDDEFTAPLAAVGYAGLGRAAVFTGEADGEYTGDFAADPTAPALFSNLAGWIQTPDSGGADYLISQHTANGALHVDVFLDPERAADPWSENPTLNTVISRRGRENRIRADRFEWVAPDRMSAIVPLTGGDVYLGTVSWPGGRPQPLAPVAELYSPEYAPRTSGLTGELERLCRITGGTERGDPAKIWSEVPEVRRKVDITRLLLAVAAALFLFEVAVRRLNLFSGRRRGFSIPTVGTVKSNTVPKPQKRRAAGHAPHPAATEVVKPKTESVENPQESINAMIDALRKAKRK